MKTVILSVVRNEEDVIEAMVRHNTAYADQIHVVDNNSCDRTYEILSLLQKEGLPLVVTNSLDSRHNQAALFTDLTNEEYRETNIIPLDADEFLLGPKDAVGSLFETEGIAYRLPWVTYISSGTDNHREINPLLRMTKRRQEEGRQYFKVTVPAHISRPLAISAGCHSVVGRKSAIHSELKIAHLPVRSPEQIAAKSLLGSWSIALRTDSKKEGYQWHALAEQIKRDGLPSRDDLEKISISYASKHGLAIVDDPIRTEARELRYTSQRQGHLMRCICGFVESLVESKN